MGILEQDNGVKSILVNIFGGILRCDILVNAVITAAKKKNLKKPIVLRLKGTNSELANEIIQASGLKNIIYCSDLDKAARKAVEIAV